MPEAGRRRLSAGAAPVFRLAGRTDWVASGVGRQSRLAPRCQLKLPSRTPSSPLERAPAGDASAQWKDRGKDLFADLPWFHLHMGGVIRRWLVPELDQPRVANRDRLAGAAPRPIWQSIDGTQECWASSCCNSLETPPGLGLHAGEHHARGYYLFHAGHAPFFQACPGTSSYLFFSSDMETRVR